jgi:hypothetical protein
MVARLAPRTDALLTVRRMPTGLATGEIKPEAANDPLPTDRVPGLDPASAIDLVVALDGPRVPQSVVGPNAIPVLTPAASSHTLPAPGSDSTPVSRAMVSPLSPGRYKLQMTIGAETLEKIRLAKDMLGHAVPSGDDAAILDRAFTSLLTELAKKKFADTPKPRTSPPAERGAKRSSGAMRKPAPRTISAAVKRAVWVRDRGRCAFSGTGGHRCNERRFVEFHHLDPYALGGEASVDGIQLRCRRHNDYEGRLYFGARRRERELVLEQVRLSETHSTSAEGW